MCGRYFICEDPEDLELAEFIQQAQRLSQSGVKTQGEIFPTDTAPVLAVNRSLDRRVFAMEWGFTLSGGKRIINARSESAAEKPLFRDSMAARRCAVLASGYYEWERRGRDHAKYAIRAKGQKALYLAGLYRMEGDGPVFSILTRPVAPEIAFIHDRMPVILPPDMVSAWIDPSVRPGEMLDRAVQNVTAERVSPEQTSLML